MKLAVAYCRVSTDHEEQKKSINEQQEQWTEFFERTDTKPAKCGLLYKKDGTIKVLENGLYVDEGISGTSLKNRRAFKLMLEDAKKKKFDMIYVEDTSRFSRSVEDGIKTVKDLRALGIGVFFRKEGWDTLKEEKDFELSLRISIAQEESRVKSERMKWAISRLHKKGGWNSFAPYGYDIEKAFLKINKEEAETVHEIYKLYTEDGFGVGKIARHLNTQQIQSKKGVQWSQPQIAHILTNEIYIGKQRTHTLETSDITRHYKIQIPEDEQIVHFHKYLRIISDDVFNLTQIERKRRNELFDMGRGHSNKHLLSTLLYCAECGGTYKRKKRHSYTRKDGTNKDIGYEWTCGVNDMYGASKCGHRNMILEDKAIKVIKEEILARRKDDLSLIFELYFKKKVEENHIKPEVLNEEKEKLMQEMRILRQDLRDKLINEIVYKDAMKNLNERVSYFNNELSRYERRQYEIENAKLKYSDYRKMLNNINIDCLSNNQLKKIFNKILVKGRIVGGKKQVFLCFQYNFLDILEEELYKEFEEQFNIWKKVG